VGSAAGGWKVGGERGDQEGLDRFVELQAACGLAGLQAIADPQLLIEMFDVILHCVDRDNQFACYLLVVPSDDQQPQHALLLRG